METVNILGETPKEQWLNAIGICDRAMRANIEFAIRHIEAGLADGQCAEWLRSAMRVLDDYTDEMRRLVEEVMG